MRDKTFVFFIYLLLMFLGVANGQDQVLKSIDDFVKAEMGRQQIPGVSLAVIKEGRPYLIKGYGFANLEHQVPVKPETIFQSGSVGKQFTAMAVMLLVEDGKIRLDEKIGRYLGEGPPAWESITVRHLLSHTGGMTDYPRDFDFRRDYSDEEIFEKAKEAPVAFKPGEKWQYSNLGYVTLGILIGKVTGKFYGEYLRERIFKPLGMSTARIINEADIIPNRAAGYRLDKGEIKNQNWVSPSLNTTADGSLYLSALDMIRWDDALTKGQLLSKASYREMWTPVRLSDGKEQPYGFGWGVRRINGKRLLDHSGAWQGFKCYIARYPDNRLTVIVFANSSNANPDRIASSVAAVLDPDLKPIPINDPDPTLSAEYRALFEGVLAERIDESRFTPPVVTALRDPDDRLLAYLRTLGAIRKFGLVDVQDVGDRKGRRYAVEFDSMSVVLELVREKGGKISHFNLLPQ